MKAITYLQGVIDRLDYLTIEQIHEDLIPLSHCPLIAAMGAVNLLRQLPDGGKQTLTVVLHSNHPDLSTEAVMPLAALKSAAKFALKNAIPIAGLSLALTAPFNKDTVAGIKAEGKRILHPSLYLSGKVPLIHATEFTHQAPSISLEDIAASITRHISYLKVLHTFISQSNFYASSLPEIDIHKWLDPLHLMGGNTASTPILFGNVKVVTTIKGKSWTTEVVHVPNKLHPKTFEAPRAMGLARHLTAAKDLLQSVWDEDTRLSSVVAAVYASLDKSKSKSLAKTMRVSINRYYTTMLSATLELALTYLKLAEHAAGVKTNDTKS